MKSETTPTHTHTTYQISKLNEGKSRLRETHSKKKEGPAFIQKQLVSKNHSNYKHE